MSEVDRSMQDVEAAARLLDAHPDYRVVRRVPEDPRSVGAGEVFRRGLYVDVETTGMHAGRDRIIELAMVLFGYDEGGRITGVEATFDALEDPGRAIPKEITALTGIRDEDVAGQAIDDDQVLELLQRADLVIAHNAPFDRGFMEARFPVFVEQPWACSSQDVPWRSLGYESNKLEYLTYRIGAFYDGHRAVNDCLAGVHLLAQPLPELEETGMARLLAAARRVDVRFEAFGSPFETKDVLKARGYRWNPDARVWWRYVPEEDVEAERGWLDANVYPSGQNAAKETRITAYERYASRR